MALFLGERSSSLQLLQDSDIPAVRKLIHKTIGQSYAEYYSPAALDFFKQFHSDSAIRERSQKGSGYVLIQGDKIIGTGAVTTNEIFGVFVDPDFQGKGYGKKIMAALEDQVQKGGYSTIELSISLPSRHFYESLGYQVVEEIHRDIGQDETLVFWKGIKQTTNGE